MELLIVGTLDGQIGAASKIAISQGGQVSLAQDIDAALNILRSGKSIELVMIDVKLDVYKFISSLESERINVLVVACGVANDPTLAVKAIKAGAKEYIPLPPDPELIGAVLAAATRENHALIYGDKKTEAILKMAKQIAPSEASVLLTGASGTGKEVFSRFIHDNSKRANKKFVAVNCAAIPETLLESELFGYEKGAFTGALREGNPGKFELADHGTLFLDEIGEMPIEFQAKLLRAVETLRIRRIGGKEEKKLDVRVIAATNRHLEQEVGRGAFRGDLYYRLNVLRLDIPPLRQRPGDIACCTDRFLARFNKRYPSRQRHLAPDAMPALLAYDWPGNVRELQNALERAFYTSSGPAITASDFHLPSSQHDALSPSSPLSPESPAEAASYERAECLHYLEEARGCVEQAASAMGVSRATFYRLCRHYGIVPKQIRRQFH